MDEQVDVGPHVRLCTRFSLARAVKFNAKDDVRMTQHDVECTLESAML